MRWAKSYSIVDHKLLHGGFLHQLSHQALALYLFLVVVGDAQGRSFYSELSLRKILRLDGDSYIQARRQLVDARLIDYQAPYFWVLNLETNHERVKSQNPIPQGGPKTFLSPNGKTTQHLT